MEAWELVVGGGGPQQWDGERLEDWKTDENRSPPPVTMTFSAILSVSSILQLGVVGVSHS